jgi:hypothetical protein
MRRATVTVEPELTSMPAMVAVDLAGMLAWRAKILVGEHEPPTYR